jgi:hypothetical protein
VFLHFGFVSQNAQVLALLGVFLDVGVKVGRSGALMAYALLFASSYFSVITPQGGSQNIIFVASGYLKQSELYRLGLLTTIFCTGGVSGHRHPLDTLGRVCIVASRGQWCARLGGASLPPAIAKRRDG